MSIETVLLLSTTTAMQGWFEARAAAEVRGTDAFGNDEGLYQKSDTRSAVFALAGRVASCLPYLASPVILDVIGKSISNPLYVGIGMVAVNVIPTAMQIIYADDEEVAMSFKAMSSILSIAMKVLNVAMICILVSGATTISPVSVGAIVISCAMSLASLAYTTHLGMKQPA